MFPTHSVLWRKINLTRGQALGAQLTTVDIVAPSLRLHKCVLQQRVVLSTAQSAAPSELPLAQNLTSPQRLWALICDGAARLAVDHYPHCGMDLLLIHNTYSFGRVRIAELRRSGRFSPQHRRIGKLKLLCTSLLLATSFQHGT
jgi:hypothetical protein